MAGAGMILGTAAYMSPEHAKGRPADKRSDVWSFGAVLYEMLTGSRPFEAEDMSETLAAVLMKEPDWSRVPGAVPPAVRALLQGCLVKYRKDRVGDISSVLFRLRHLASLDRAARRSEAASRFYRTSLPQDRSALVGYRLLMFPVDLGGQVTSVSGPGNSN